MSTGAVGAMPWPFTTRPMMRRIGRASTPPGRNHRAYSIDPQSFHGSAEHVTPSIPKRQRSRDRADPRAVSHNEIRSEPVGPQERMDWLIALERIDQKFSHLDL